MMEYTEDERRIVEDGINNVLQEGYRKILVYPYGRLGQYAYQCLKQYQDVELWRADNINSGEGIMSSDEVISFLERNPETVLLFSAINVYFYEKIDWTKYRKLKNHIVSVKLPTRAEIQLKSLLRGDELSAVERKSYDMSAYLEEMSVYVSEDDFFAGHMGKDISYADPMIAINLKTEINNIFIDTSLDYTDILEMENRGLICRNAGNHMIPGYDRILRTGLAYFIDEIRSGQDNFEESDRYLIHSAKMLKSLQVRIRNYTNAAKKIDGENARRIQIACEHIEEEAPRTLFEAIQLLILLHEAVVAEAGCGSISFGRIDQYLYPFYKDDIDSDRISKEEAQEMMIALWMKIAELPTSWQNITLGGRLIDGSDGCNDITMMALEATGKV
ncbi:MAG: hypothetical protein K6G05_02870, partial [Lachnospiraceae bacterium]|nr:hypothetical protein [Lachnospiraceae bacterium]